MPPSEIAIIAVDAGAKALILSHRMQRTLGQEKQTLSLLRRKYSGPVFFANDLGLFELDKLLKNKHGY